MSSNIIKDLSLTYLEVPNAVGKHVHSLTLQCILALAFFLIFFLEAFLKGIPKRGVQSPPSPKYSFFFFNLSPSFFNDSVNWIQFLAPTANKLPSAARTSNCWYAAILTMPCSSKNNNNNNKNKKKKTGKKGKSEQEVVTEYCCYYCHCCPCR